MDRALGSEYLQSCFDLIFCDLSRLDQKSQLEYKGGIYHFSVWCIHCTQGGHSRQARGLNYWHCRYSHHATAAAVIFNFEKSRQYSCIDCRTYHGDPGYTVASL